MTEDVYTATKPGLQWEPKSISTGKQAIMWSSDRAVVGLGLWGDRADSLSAHSMGCHLHLDFRVLSALGVHGDKVGYVNDPGFQKEFCFSFCTGSA